MFFPFLVWLLSVERRAVLQQFRARWSLYMSHMKSLSPWVQNLKYVLSTSGQAEERRGRTAPLRVSPKFAARRTLPWLTRCKFMLLFHAGYTISGQQFSLGCRCFAFPARPLLLACGCVLKLRFAPAFSFASFAKMADPRGQAETAWLTKLFWPALWEKHTGVLIIPFVRAPLPRQAPPCTAKPK